MDQPSNLPFPVGWPLILAASVVVVLAAAVVWWVLRRRAARTIQARLRQACEEILSSVLIPNAETGQIHIEYALLTGKGIVVVDLRDVGGNVFGSESMQEWTVLDSGKRFTFPNPLPVLYDRVAAVRRLLPETPVRGCVVFTARARFSKGLPPNVVLIDDFLAGLATERDAPDGAAKTVLQQSWSRLRAQAVESPG